MFENGGLLGSGGPAETILIFEVLRAHLLDNKIDVFCVSQSVKSGIRTKNSQRNVQFRLKARAAAAAAAAGVALWRFPFTHHSGRVSLH